MVAKKLSRSVGYVMANFQALWDDTVLVKTFLDALKHESALYQAIKGKWLNVAQPRDLKLKSSSQHCGLVWDWRNPPGYWKPNAYHPVSRMQN